MRIAVSAFFVFLLCQSAFCLGIKEVEVPYPVFRLESRIMDEAALSALFDGSGINSPVVVTALYGSLPDSNANKPVLSYSMKPHCAYEYNIPEPVMGYKNGLIPDKSARDKDLNDYIVPLNNNESKICAQARRLIKESSLLGQRLFDANRDVVIVWGETGDENHCAGALIPVWGSNLKTIFLNPKKKNILMKNPALLAIILAHEFSHEADYKTINGGFAEKSAVHYISEEKAYLTQVYMYHKLKNQLPKDDADKEYLRFLDEQRFLQAIWNFKQGKALRPQKTDFPYLRELGFGGVGIEEIIVGLKSGISGIYSFQEFLKLTYGFENTQGGNGVDFKKLADNAVRDYTEYRVFVNSNPDSSRGDSTQSDDGNEESSQGNNDYPGTDINQPHTPDIPDSPNWDGAW